MYLVPAGNFLANYNVVKLPACATEVSITRSDKYYADVWLVRCKNDNYVRNQTWAKYSPTVGPGFDSKFHSFYKLSR